MSDISTIQQAAALGRGVGGSAGHFGVREATGCSSRLQNEGVGGEGRGEMPSPTASTGLLKLRLHLSGESKGSEIQFQSPFLSPSAEPQPVAQGGQVPPCSLPRASSPLPSPAPSATRTACKAWRDLAGPLAHGLTSGLGQLLTF